MRRPGVEMKYPGEAQNLADAAARAQLNKGTPNLKTSLKPGAPTETVELKPEECSADPRRTPGGLPRGKNGDVTSMGPS